MHDGYETSCDGPTRDQRRDCRRSPRRRPPPRTHAVRAGLAPRPSDVGARSCAGAAQPTRTTAFQVAAAASGTQSPGTAVGNAPADIRPQTCLARYFSRCSQPLQTTESREISPYKLSGSLPAQ